MKLKITLLAESDKPDFLAEANKFVEESKEIRTDIAGTTLLDATVTVVSEDKPVRVKTACCNYEASVLNFPVYYNEFNNAVQCHNCGHVYTPVPVKLSQYES